MLRNILHCQFGEKSSYKLKGLIPQNNWDSETYAYFKINTLKFNIYKALVNYFLIVLLLRLYFEDNFLHSTFSNISFSIKHAKSFDNFWSKLNEEFNIFINLQLLLIIPVIYFWVIGFWFVDFYLQGDDIVSFLGQNENIKKNIYNGYKIYFSLCQYGTFNK